MLEFFFDPFLPSKKMDQGWINPKTCGVTKIMHKLISKILE